MTKRYDDPIDVVGDPVDPDLPVGFTWRGRRYEVDLRLERWREAAPWRPQQTVRDRDCFRVLARPAGLTATGECDPDGFMVSAGAVYDVYRDPIRGWRLARLWD